MVHTQINHDTPFKCYRWQQWLPVVQFSFIKKTVSCMLVNNKI